MSFSSSFPVTGWPTHEVNSANEEDYFSFTNNLPPLDYVPKHNQYLLSVDDFLNVYGIDERFNSQDQEIRSMVQSYEYQNLNQNQNQNPPVMTTYTCDEDDNGGGSNDISKTRLSRENISKYYYMPLLQATKELDVGPTSLKKRCRELGICRWPRRKLISLQTLIKNVQELGTVSGERAEKKLGKTVLILEKERRKMEEVPNLKFIKLELMDYLREQCLRIMDTLAGLLDFTERLRPKWSYPPDYLDWLDLIS